MADEPAQASNEKQFFLQKIYIKDMSFESPKAPEVFTSSAQANTHLSIGMGNHQIDGDHVEVSLTLTIQSKDQDETLFLIEIVQAGVFTISGYTDQERVMLLGRVCPATLYPFARKAVAEIANKGGFPQLLLRIINFDALHAQSIQERLARAGGQPIQVQMPGGDAVEAPAESSADRESGDAKSHGDGDTH